MNKEAIQAILAKHLKEKKKIEGIHLFVSGHTIAHNLLGSSNEDSCELKIDSPIEVQYEEEHLVLKGHCYRYDNSRGKKNYDYDFIEYVTYSDISRIKVNYKK